MVHGWKETGQINGPSRRAESDFQRAILNSGIDREELWPSAGIHESAVALRVDGIREAQKHHEGVLGSPNWCTGTGDYYWRLVDDTLWVDDLKTGKVYLDDEGNNRFPQDVRSPQLRFYALALAHLNDYRGVVNVSLTHWPRLPLELRHSPPVRFWTEYHTDELYEFWTELEQLYRDASDGRAGLSFVVNPGDHCRFCPARDFCIDAQQFEPYNWRNQ